MGTFLKRVIEPLCRDLALRRLASEEGRGGAQFASTQGTSWIDQRRATGTQRGSRAQRDSIQ